MGMIARTSMLRLAALGVALTLGAPAGLAAGSDSSEPPKKTKTSTECTDGKIYDEKTGQCADPKQGYFDDDTLYKAARELAYAGQYENAIRILKVAANQEDPRILNYLGYSNRMAGRMDVGMAYYRKALARDPNYILARSYMGQALLLEGNVAGAVEQLAEIRQRGGEETWAYRALLQSFGGTAYN